MIKNILISLLLFSSTAIAQPKVLMIGTSHNSLGETEHQTGVWLSELSHAYDEFIKSNIKVSFASIDGNGYPLDPGSLDQMDASAKNFLLSSQTRALLGNENVMSLSQAAQNDYDAVYLIGGHGVMWDFKGNPELDAIIYNIYDNNGVLGAVCHGSAGLLTATDEVGNLLIEGKNITGFSDEEEENIKLTKIVPFSLEQSLVQANVKYQKTDNNFESFSIIDGRIVTGQNPASATAVAINMIALLTAK
ncbi:MULTISPECIES: type 1 glutamine amidotransferase domain-containing protein [unclassified Vibrio]|uniref:type 1 glutamine amidotransferase domain-containing protein n=1 Tax=unclassified Vibrio TaxID=2614977 RepID=UPI00355383B5